MSKKEYEFVPIYKCRKCKEIVGSMGEICFFPREEYGYLISEESVLDRLEPYSCKTRIHKGCMGVCEIIRFDKV